MHRICVVQYETRQDRCLRVLMKYTESYCEYNGYTYICPNQIFDLPTYWIKVHLVQQLLEQSEFDAIVWVDSDAVFVDPSIRIESIFERVNKPFITSMDPGSTTTMNAGVFFVQNTPEMRSLMKTWMGLYSPDRWYKEGGVWKTTGRWAGPDYEQGSFNEQILTGPFSEQISLQGEKVFACYEPFYGSDTIVCHFMYKHKWKGWIFHAKKKAPEVAFWFILAGIMLYNIKRKK